MLISSYIHQLQEISKNISKAELSPILDGLVNITNAKDNDVGSMYPRELESVTNALDVVAKLADSGHPLTENQSRVNIMCHLGDLTCYPGV